MTYLDWIRELGSHPPFGRGDRLGSVNHIDDAARARAAAAIRTGRSIGLSKTLTAGSSVRRDDLPAYALESFYSAEPVGVYTESAIGTGSEHVRLDCHGILNTHIDGLNHTAIDGFWYAGHAVGVDDAPSILEMSGTGIVTRAVHLDIAALRGTDWIDVERPVTSADLEAALAVLDVRLEPGDAVLVDMGRDRFEAAGGDVTAPTRPGLGEDAARWLATSRIGLLCWDFLDAKHPDEPPACVHLLNWAIGLVLVDNCDFSAAREVLAGVGGIGALMVAPPAMPRASGANVNPLVVV